MDFRAKTKPWGRRNCLYSSETWLYRGTDLKKVTGKNSAVLKITKSPVASIILKWKKFRKITILPRAGCQAKLSNRGRRALVREVTKNAMVTLAELQRSCMEMGETSTHHCNTPPIWALWQSGLKEASPRWKDTKDCFGFAKKHLQAGFHTKFANISTVPAKSFVAWVDKCDQLPNS